MRELSRSPSKYVKLANEKDEVIITKNGHPYAILVKFNEDDLEDFIIAKHLDIEADFETAKSELRKGKTVNAHDLLKQINESSE